MRSEQLAEKYAIFSQAISAAKNEAIGRQEAAGRQIREEREKLAQIVDAQEDAMNALRAAITAGRDDTAERKAVEDLTIQRSTAEKIVEAVATMNGKPSKETATAAVDALRAMSKQARDDQNGIYDRLAQIKAQITELEQERDALYKQSDDADRLGSNTRTQDKVVELYEAAFGPIDVTGHTCGPDENAKRRFIMGVSAGIENTPAGHKLAE